MIMFFFKLNINFCVDLIFKSVFKIQLINTRDFNSMTIFFSILHKRRVVIVYTNGTEGVSS